MSKKNLFLALLLIFSGAQAQVLIFTYAYNRPDFIEIQYRTLQKFFLDDYEFVVFNDARDHNLKEQIEAMCAKLAVRCIRIPQEIHDRPYLERLPGENYQFPTVRNVNVVQYSLDVIGFDHDDIVILLDSDMFLVKPFSVRKFLNGYGLGGASAGNGYVSFLWHALAFLDMKAMPNKHTLTFNCGQVEGHPIDGGGHSYYYIKNNPDVQIRYVNHFYSGNFHCDSCKSTNQQLCTHNTEKLMTEGFDNNQLLFLQSACNVEFFHNNSFLHYRGGTNWDNQSQKYHQMKTAALNTYLAAILEETYAKQN